MILIPDPWWLPTILAVVLLFDAVLSLWPPKFIRDCLNGVGFPKNWWWTLIVIKILAVIGLIAGIWIPGVGFSANVGVVAYFVCAGASHVKARFFGQAFWVNCLGMFTLATLSLVFSFLV